MGLLFVAPNPPSPKMGGGSLRMYHMLRFLGKRFTVDLVAPAFEGAAEAERLLKGYCRNMEFVSAAPGQTLRARVRLGPYDKDPALAQAVQRRLATGAYQAIQVEKPASLPYVPHDVRIPVVLDTWAYGLTGPLRALKHERGLVAKGRNAFRVVRFGLYDRFCWPQTHCILVVSDGDAEQCRRAHSERHVLVVANGVDCEAVRPAPVPAKGSVLLFTGDMEFAPNIEAAELLIARILPAVQRQFREAELRVVGRNPDAKLLGLTAPGLTITGGVPDMVPSLHEARIFVAPLFTGAGSRTKVLEAMAAGLPVVTTPIGMEGIAVQDGKDVILAGDVESFVRAVCRLLRDREECRRLGASARRLVETRYDWRRCLAPLGALYEPLLQKKMS